MKWELSKVETIQLGAKIFCGVLCVSLVGGTMAYYKMEEMKAQKQVAYEIENGLNGYEPIEETKNEVLESLLAKPLSETQLAQIDKNTVIVDTEKTQETKGTFIDGIKVAIDNAISSISNKDTDTYNTGFDKNGNPYLKKGASYTFKADGTPVEAPPTTKYTVVTNPATGIRYAYNTAKQEWYNKDEVQKDNEFQRRVSKGLTNSAGEENVRSLTKEEIEAVGSWSVNVGSMGYK